MRSIRRFFNRWASAFAPLSSEKAASWTANPSWALPAACAAVALAGAAQATGAASRPPADAPDRGRGGCGWRVAPTRGVRCGRRRRARRPGPAGRIVWKPGCRTSGASRLGRRCRRRDGVRRRRGSRSARPSPARPPAADGAAAPDAVVASAACGELVDELAVVHRRDLDRNVVAERLRLAFEQHRNDDRDGQREYDCADQASAGASTQFVDIDVQVLRSNPSDEVVNRGYARRRAQRKR